MTNPIFSNLSRIKITVLLFGRESELTCKFKNYVRPYLEVETMQGTRIFHESIVKEIIPLIKEQNQQSNSEE
jgi:hypothetical protein